MDITEHGPQNDFIHHRLLAELREGRYDESGIPGLQEPVRGGFILVPHVRQRSTRSQKCDPDTIRFELLAQIDRESPQSPLCDAVGRARRIGSVGRRGPDDYDSRPLSFTENRQQMPRQEEIRVEVHGHGSPERLLLDCDQRLFHENSCIENQKVDGTDCAPHCNGCATGRVFAVTEVDGEGPRQMLHARRCRGQALAVLTDQKNSPASRIELERHGKANPPRASGDDCVPHRHLQSCSSSTMRERMTIFNAFDTRITAMDFESQGLPEIVKRVRARIQDAPLYVSIDIDVLDPGTAPGTGTPECR